MPLAFDPEQVAEFTLKADEARPPERRATFRSKYLTGREVLRRGQFYREALELANADAIIAKLGEMFAVGMKSIRLPGGDWQPFTIDAVLDNLTTAEMWTLAVEWPERVAELESSLGKALPSPAPSATAA